MQVEELIQYNQALSKGVSFEIDLDEMKNEQEYFDYVLSKTSFLFNISENEIMGRSRKGEVVIARQFICWFLRRQSTFKRFSYPAMGRLMQRDHATVMHSVRKIQDAVDIYKNKNFINYSKQINKQI
jgi:chromosomal replication initiator protein